MEAKAVSSDMTTNNTVQSQGKPRFRFVVMGALWVTFFFLFLDRVNISMAAPYLMDEMGFSGKQMGLILSVYYWGYRPRQDSQKRSCIHGEFCSLLSSPTVSVRL